MSDIYIWEQHQLCQRLLICLPGIGQIRGQNLEVFILHVRFSIGLWNALKNIAEQNLGGSSYAEAAYGLYPVPFFTGHSGVFSSHTTGKEVVFLSQMIAINSGKIILPALAHHPNWWRLYPRFLF